MTGARFVAAALDAPSWPTKFQDGNDSDMGGPIAALLAQLEDLASSYLCFSQRQLCLLVPLQSILSESVSTAYLTCTRRCKISFH